MGLDPEDPESNKKLDELVKQGKLRKDSSWTFCGESILHYLRTEREVTQKQVKKIEELLKELNKKMDTFAELDKKVDKLTGMVKKLQAERVERDREDKVKAQIKG